jgi:hypothetical protein
MDYRIHVAQTQDMCSAQSTWRRRSECHENDWKGREGKRGGVCKELSEGRERKDSRGGEGREVQSCACPALQYDIG